ncbi:MAG: aspartate aminotransferase family protein [Bacillota bacterium]
MKKVQDLEKQFIINTYNRQADTTPCLVRGEGSFVWDEKGNKYLDFLGGLAVNVVGHCHPQVVEAICEQSSRLIHTSNLYYGEPQAELARVLVENSLPDGRVFYANSGAEANEAAIKLARKHKESCFKIITAENSFHGRTMATVAATGQPKYHQPFAPVVEGFSYGKFNDLDSFKKLVDSETAAIMVEPIQGEGGVHVATESFVRGLRELCDHEKILLIFDEVQCGMGRTGKLWAFENYGVQPDLFTTAKGLGGGMPIGVMVAADNYTEVLQPGDHASTFGGNHVVCSAALVVFDLILGEGFLENVSRKGTIIQQEMESLIKEFPNLFKEYRGMGLICALELQQAGAKDILTKCLKAGLLINAIGDTTIRLLPPLNISKSELMEGLRILKEIATSVYE